MINIENYLIYVVMPILCVSMVLILIRFLKGPQIFERVIALDLLITLGVGFIGVFSIIAMNKNFLDVAMILALIAFLSTLAFSFYLYKSNKND